MQSNYHELSLLFMKILSHHFCVTKQVNARSKDDHVMVQVDPILDACTLGQQMSLFKLLMKLNCHLVMAEPQDANSMTKLSETLAKTV